MYSDLVELTLFEQQLSCTSTVSFPNHVPVCLNQCVGRDNYLLKMSRGEKHVTFQDFKLSTL